MGIFHRPRRTNTMADKTKMTQDEIIARAFVSTIRNERRMDIQMGNMNMTLFPDEILKHDMSLVVQEFFKRTGKIRRQL